MQASVSHITSDAELRPPDFFRSIQTSGTVTQKVPDVSPQTRHVVQRDVELGFSDSKLK